MPRSPRVLSRAAEAIPDFPETDPVRSRRTTLAVPLVFILFVLLVSATGAAGYFYYQFKQSGSAAEKEEIDGLVKTVGAFLDLPEEEPTLATVTDKEKLAEQPFFQRAENGDKVLIFAESGKAILYRPSSGKIIEMTTVNVTNPNPVAQTVETPPVSGAVDEPQPVPSVPAAPGQKVSVALYNGTDKLGITNALEDTLIKSVDGLTVVAKETAKRNDYGKTLVVDLTGKNAALVASIAREISADVAEFPDGETRPGGDILIILGADRK